MFKSCCSRSKRMNKSKSNSDNLDSAQELHSNLTQNINIENDVNNQTKEKEVNESKQSFPLNMDNQQTKSVIAEEDSVLTSGGDSLDTIHDDDKEASVPGDSFDACISKKDLMKKRYSVDYKRNRHEFKRYSVDFRTDAATLDELSRLEKELARTNVDVRPPNRRKSVGILKSTTSYSDIPETRPDIKPDSLSEDDEVFEAVSERKKDEDGSTEPPATPVGRDELALRRHRFFSDLVCAARAAVEHRVRFDPLGPVVADHGSDLGAVAAIGPASDLEALIERLELVTLRLERLPVLRARTPPKSPAPSPQSTPPPSPPPEIVEETDLVDTDDMSVNGYQDLLQGPLSAFLSLSEQIGGDVATHAKLVNAAFQAQLRYIQLATARSKPSPHEQVSLLTPTSDQISAIQQYREKNRVSKFFNHLSAISESIPALGWVAIAPTPGPYVKEMNDAGQFYTNRVLKEWKEKDKKHAEWCRAWVQLLTDLQAYVKQHHTTGLVWSGTGAGAPPPPPGPPPPPSMPVGDFSNLSVSDDRSALFAEINRGEGITNSLRKVTSEMQTHKNPQLRQGPAPFRAPTASAPAKPLPGAGAGTLPDKPPVFNRDGKKWIIEYQKGNQNLVVENAEMNNVVYMFRCRDSALTIRGKINGVVLDSCSKCALVFDHLVSSAEFVNCQSVQMQVIGKVPTVSIDKTDGCQIYLSQDSLGVEIISSKSSEINVLVPTTNGEYTEHAVPEQYKTVLKGRSLQTTPVESLG